MILTNTEIAEAYYEGTTQPLREQDKTLAFAFAAAFEAALLAKLAAGVEMPEPLGECTVVANTFFRHPLDTVMRIDAYSFDQLQTHGAAERVKALEDAAKACGSTVWSADIDVWRDMTKRDVAVKSMLACAETIRALKGGV